jgi:L-ascorbate metabolism protein UlaG (beta-lactamase superfamily)
MKKTLTLISFLSIAMSCSSKEFKNPYRAPYDGEKFQNLEPFPPKSFFSLMKWKLFKNDRKEWPEWLDLPMGNKPIERTKKGEIIYTVVNHATVLLQVDGINILTDPIWSMRTSPVSFAGPKRIHAPTIRFEDLPPIDVVVISHNHYDHLDIPTLKDLSDKHSPIILVGLKNGELLKSEGIKNFVEMDWYQKYDYKELKITFMPNQHWSARGLFDKFETLWGGYIIESKRGEIYFAGDTGYGKFFKEIKKEFKNIILSFLPIGAYEPRWFMKPAHINPEEAVKGHIELGSKHSVGIHFGTFQLTDEGRDEPIDALKRSLKGVDISFLVPDFGKAYSL